MMKLSLLAKELGLDFKGRDFEVEGFSTLENASTSHIVFFNDGKLSQKLKTTEAGAVLVSEEFKDLVPKNSVALVCDDPHLYMAKASKFFVKRAFESGKNIVSDNAFVAEGVFIGKGTVIEEGVVIHPNVTIGANVKIEEGSVIYPGVSVYDDTKIGKNCIIHSGVVLGGDGFGYAHTKTGEHIKIYHSGNLILEDEVEIGSNSTVDRAVFGSTVIKRGTKIDNLVQIGHNCELGEGCILVSQVGLSGSTTLGRNVIMGGQSATAGHLKIGDFAMIAARGGVSKSIEGGKTYGGFPLMLQKDWLKQQIKISKFFKKDRK